MPSFHCDAPGCVRGIIHKGAFGEPCSFCEGRGQLALAELARKLDEDPVIIQRLTKPRRKMRVKTCQRLLKKLMDVIAPKQPTLFGET